jgi:hypothetical protein
LRRRLGVLQTLVGEKHMLAKADAPRDGLADLPGADHDDYLCHS